LNRITDKTNLVILPKPFNVGFHVLRYIAECGSSHETSPIVLDVYINLL
jgi:hypothetical protein